MTTTQMPKIELKKGNEIIISMNFNSPFIGFAKIDEETEKAVKLTNSETHISGWFPKSSLSVNRYNVYSVNQWFRNVLKHEHKLFLMRVFE